MLELEGVLRTEASTTRLNGPELEPIAESLSRLESVSITLGWEYRRREAFRKRRSSQVGQLVVTIPAQDFKGKAEAFWDGMGRADLAAIVRNED